MSCLPQACYTLRRRTTEYTSTTTPTQPSVASSSSTSSTLVSTSRAPEPVNLNKCTARQLRASDVTGPYCLQFDNQHHRARQRPGQKEKKKSRLDCALLRVAAPTIVAQSCADLTAIACTATPRPTSVAHCLSSCAIGITISSFHPTTWPVGLPNSHTSSSCSCVFR